MRAFSVGVSIRVSTGKSGVSPADLAALARSLEAIGVEALFVTAEPDLESITALAGIAPLCDLVLGAVIPLSSARLPTIVAKRATTLALLAEDRTALVFRDDVAENQVELLEAVKAASMMAGPGPLDFVGSTIRLVGAYNEPRPAESATLGVGAWTASPTPMLAAECDLLILDGPAPVGPVGALFTITARPSPEPHGDPGAKRSGAQLFAIEGGEIDRICELASAALISATERR